MRKGKTKSDLFSKEVLEHLLVTGVLTAAVTAPYLAVGAIPVAQALKQKGKRREEKLQNTLSYLKRNGYIEVESSRGKVSLSLTDKGKRRARGGKIQTTFTVRRPQRWDGKWRIVMFDVPAGKKVVRDALRHFLKRLEFVPLQKSAWVLPFDCREEIDFLRNFFELKERDLRLIVADDIGDAAALRKKFHI